MNWWQFLFLIPELIQSYFYSNTKNISICYSPSSLLIPVSGHWEPKQAARVALVNHGVLGVQVEAVDDDEDQLEGQHRGPHCHCELVTTGLTESFTVSAALLLLPASSVRCEEESREMLWLNKRGTWEGQSQSSDLSSLKIQQRSYIVLNSQHSSVCKHTDFDS